MRRQRPQTRLASPLLLLVALLLSMGATACGPGYLDAGQKVEATDENKEVYDVLKAYHKAMEERDIQAIQKMVSVRYYENGGTTDNDKDDYGVDRLKVAVLPRLRDNVKRLQFRIKLLAIRVDGQEAQAEYEFFGRVLLTEGGRESYKMWNDFASMQLVRENGAWKILRGL